MADIAFYRDTFLHVLDQWMEVQGEIRKKQEAPPKDLELKERRARLAFAKTVTIICDLISNEFREDDNLRRKIAAVRRPLPAAASLEDTGFQCGVLAHLRKMRNMLEPMLDSMIASAKLAQEGNYFFSNNREINDAAYKSKKLFMLTVKMIKDYSQHSAQPLLRVVAARPLLRIAAAAAGAGGQESDDE